MVYTDPQSAYADVEAGNLDSMNTVPTSALSTFESDDQVQAVNEPGIVSRSFTFAAGQKHFSLDDEGRLRRAAVSMAINPASRSATRSPTAPTRRRRISPPR